MKDINCPYCNHAQDIDRDNDGWHKEDGLHEQFCGNCEKYFTFTTYLSFSFTAYKADCLNGAEHEYTPNHTIPKEFTKMQCSMCEDCRELIESERLELGIGTKESYYENLKQNE